MKLSKQLNKKELLIYIEICESIWGCVPVEVKWASDTNIFKNYLSNNILSTHTFEERLEGINKTCTLSQKEIKECMSFRMIGDRGCDNRHIPDYKFGDDIIRICKYNNKILTLKPFEIF